MDPENGPSASAAFAAASRRPWSTKSFVDGSGSVGVLDGMWPYVSEALDGAFVVSIEETAAALQLMAERCA
jgi:hypothetical protein